MSQAEQCRTSAAVHPLLFSRPTDAAWMGQAAAGPSSRILIYSENRAMRNFLRREFVDLNFAAEICTAPAELTTLLQTRSFDLLLIDQNEVETDPFARLEEIRAAGAERLPILILAARTGGDDTIQALDSGADDCLIKPFSLQEMQARVRSLLRRRGAPVAVTATATAGLQLRADQNIVVRGIRRIQLTAREFGILEYLMAHYGNTVSRADLLRDVWQTEDDPRTNLVDVYMKYLRDKLDIEGEPKLIRTVRGIGYILSAE